MSYPSRHQTPAYRTLLAFIGSLTYTDFSTVRYADIKALLQQAGVPFETEGFIVDVFPYTTSGEGITCELMQETGHRNRVYFTFDDQSLLTDFHLRTSL
jgi:hypothetical protein